MFGKKKKEFRKEKKIITYMSYYHMIKSSHKNKIILSKISLELRV
jgi:hypothetical protein